MMRGKAALLLVIGMLFASPLWAISGKGTTAATFLKVGLGPRAVAMGECFVAVADDVSAIYWNPAGLAQLALPEVTAMHVFWIQDIYFDHLAGSMPIPSGVVATSLVYLNHGQIIRSQAGDTTQDPERGTFSAVDFGFTGAYAYPFTPAMSLGGGLKLFSESIDAQASFGWALDLGFHYRLPWEGFTFGAVLQNLGPATRVEEEYFRLPINFKLGFAWRPRQEILLAMDYNQLLEQYGKIALGAEYCFEKILALRVGYQYQEKIDPGEWYADFGTNALAGVTTGLGVTYADFRLDYAYVPYGFLGTAHRLAITYRFSSAKPPVEKAENPKPLGESLQPAPAP